MPLSIAWMLAMARQQGRAKKPHLVVGKQLSCLDYSPGETEERERYRSYVVHGCDRVETQTPLLEQYLHLHTVRASDHSLLAQILFPSSILQCIQALRTKHHSTKSRPSASLIIRKHTGHTSVNRVDSVATDRSCRNTPTHTRLISPYEAMATPAVTTSMLASTLVLNVSLPNKHPVANTATGISALSICIAEWRKPESQKAPCAVCTPVSHGGHLIASSGALHLHHFISFVQIYQSSISLTWMNETLR